MGKVRRKFTDDFKIRLVEQIKSGAITPSAAARKHQISSGLVYTWMRQLSGKSVHDVAFRPSAREKELERENALLKEKLADLFMQVELLKKAEDWISQRKSATSSIITASSLARYKKGVK